MNPIPIKSKIESLKPFKVSRMKEVIKPTKPHKHADYYELIYLTAGSGTHVIDDVVFGVKPLTVFFLKPNQTHFWDFASVPKGFVLLFKEEIFFNKSVRNLIYKMPVLQVLQDDAFLKILFEKLMLTDADVDIISCYITVLIHHLSENQYFESSVKSQLNDVVYQFNSLLDQHFHHLKRVTDYSEKLNITPQNLNELCKKALGKTAQQLIKERVFVESKVLLSHTKKSISEIAFALNFSDASHFNKFFKSQSKITPKTYRNLL